MPKTLAILSSVKWSFSWQRHQSFATAAAADGWRVVYVEPSLRSIRQGFARLRRVGRVPGPPTNPVPDGVTVLPWSPKRLTGSAIASMVRGVLGASPDLLLAYVPSGQTVDIINSLKPRAAAYDEVLDWDLVPADWYPPRSWRSAETRLYNWARAGRLALLTDAIGVQEKWARSGLTGTLVLPAADSEFLARAWSEPALGGAIGYFGTVDPDVVDVEYLAALAREHAVEVVGHAPAEVVGLLEAAGAQVRGHVCLEELVEILDRWSAIVLPYRPNRRGRSFMPAKTWNALATRRPVFVKEVTYPPALQELFHQLPLAPDRFVLNAPAVDVGAVPTWSQRWRAVVDATEGASF